MSNQTLLIPFLAAAAFVAGCDKEQTTAQPSETVNTATHAAAQDMKDYTFAQKAEFVAVMQNQLAALNQDLDTLSARIDGSSDAVKAEAKPKLQALRDQAAGLNQQLEAVKAATESTWDSLKAGWQNAWDSLKDGIQQTREWAGDQTAP